ncbi:MAG: helix-turn-helix domain-containing protein [Flavobacteriaceae bacterium]
MKTIGQKIAEIRKQKGLSQEELSENSKVSLRTIQRIEKDETDPRGATLKAVCDALQINIEDILDYGKHEDKTYLIFLHLSVLMFWFIPFGNIILPLILWLNKRDKIVDAGIQGANILNFQILWTIISNICVIMFAVFALRGITEKGLSYTFLLVALGFYLINSIYPIINAILIKKGKTGKFYPEIIRFVKA